MHGMKPCHRHYDCYGGQILHEQFANIYGYERYDPSYYILLVLIVRSLTIRQDAANHGNDAGMIVLASTIIGHNDLKDEIY